MNNSHNQDLAKKKGKNKIKTLGNKNIYLITLNGHPTFYFIHICFLMHAENIYKISIPYKFPLYIKFHIFVN